VLTDALNVTEHSPVVIGVTPAEVDCRKPFTLELFGKYIRDDAKVELVADGDGKTVAGSWQRPKDQSKDQSKGQQKDQAKDPPKDQSNDQPKDESKEQPKLVVSFPGMEPGVYSMVVTSAGQKFARLPSALKVFKPAPDLSRFSEESSLRVARIAGGNWTEGMKAYIVKGESRQEVSIFGQTADGFSIVYENDLKPGKYDLVLVNNEGKESTLKNVLEVRSDASDLPALWVGGGIDTVYSGGRHFQPSVTVDWALVHRVGFSLGYEAGLSCLIQFPDNENKSFCWFAQWYGYTLKQLNGVNTMTLRVPIGVKFASSTLSYPYTGLYLDYELGKNWLAEIGYEYDLFADDAPYSAAIHLTALKQF
jgi:hypothetical protein